MLMNIQGLWLLEEKSIRVKDQELLEVSLTELRLLAHIGYFLGDCLYLELLVMLRQKCQSMVVIQMH